MTGAVVPHAHVLHGKSSSGRKSRAIWPSPRMQIYISAVSSVPFPTRDKFGKCPNLSPSGTSPPRHRHRLDSGSGVNKRSHRRVGVEVGVEALRYVNLLPLHYVDKTYSLSYLGMCAGISRRILRVGFRVPPKWDHRGRPLDSYDPHRSIR